MKSKNITYPKNPLGIIAIFVFLIEGISTISLKFVIDASIELASLLVWFIILFPSAIVILFFITLWFKREGLYSPSDFKDDISFISLLEKKLERLNIRQEAAEIDPQDSFEDIFNMIQKLVSNKEISTAIHLAKAPLKVNRHEIGLKCFEYLNSAIPDSSPYYIEILFNLSKCYKGLERYDEMLKALNSLRKKAGESDFRAEHAVAFAYSNYKLGNIDTYHKWLDYAKMRDEYDPNLPNFERLYPEIKDDLY